MKKLSAKVARKVERSAADRRADKSGAHGEEGSPKDLAADRKLAKKLGFMKKRK